MTTANEVVTNTMLSGAEMKVLIRQALEKLLANEGMLADHMAFGRAAYDLTLRLHLDHMSPGFRESTVRVASKGPGASIHGAIPEPAAIVHPPIADPSPDVIAVATTIAHHIESPNLERLASGMPVPVIATEQDGTKVIKSMTYPADSDIVQDIRLSDTQSAAGGDWGALNEVVAMPERSKAANE